MKLLTLFGFLFFYLLCLSAFATEGRKVRKLCCSQVPKLNKKVHKGVNLKITQMEKKKYCKPCPTPLMVPGPLPQLK